MTTAEALKYYIASLDELYFPIIGKKALCWLIDQSEDLTRTVSAVHHTTSFTGTTSYPPMDEGLEIAKVVTYLNVGPSGFGFRQFCLARGITAVFNYSSSPPVPGDEMFEYIITKDYDALCNPGRGTAKGVTLDIKAVRRIDLGAI